MIEVKELKRGRAWVIYSHRTDNLQHGLGWKLWGFVDPRRNKEFVSNIVNFIASSGGEDAFENLELATKRSSWIKDWIVRPSAGSEYILAAGRGVIVGDLVENIRIRADEARKKDVVTFEVPERLGYAREGGQLVTLVERQKISFEIVSGEPLLNL